MATHFPQAAAMVLAITAAAALFGQHTWRLAFVFLAASCGQSLVGWLNDFLDAQNDINLERGNKPAVKNQLDVRLLKTPMLVASVLVVPFSLLAAGWLGGFAHLFAVSQGLIYDRYLARTSWSWVPYATAFGALPFFVAQSVALTAWPSWQIVAAAALVGVIAHLLNALPDIALDEKLGHSGLAVFLGAAKTKWMLVILFTLATSMLVWAIALIL
jgi:4-hydroxybenzoate polyprenyltransferase